MIAVTNKKKILFVRQFRHPVGKVTWEIPAGKNSRFKNDDWAHGLQAFYRWVGGSGGVRMGPLGSLGTMGSAVDIKASVKTSLRFGPFIFTSSSVRDVSMQASGK